MCEVNIEISLLQVMDLSEMKTRSQGKRWMKEAEMWKTKVALLVLTKFRHQIVGLQSSGWGFLAAAQRKSTIVLRTRSIFSISTQ